LILEISQFNLEELVKNALTQYSGWFSITF
jgi:hypothetical protein